MTLIHEFFGLVQASIGTKGAVDSCARALERRAAAEREVDALAARLAAREPAPPLRHSA